VELRHLRYLAVLAEELHFSRAAERLGIAQPALTQQIQHLERELAVRLFHRTKRSVQLTVAGRLTLEQALRTLQQAERTELIARQAGRGEKGLIEIGYVGSAAFSGILSRTISAYRKTNPNVDLHLHELGIRRQLDDLESGHLDIGFLRLPVKQWPVGLTSLTLLSEPIIVAIPAEHSLAKRRAIPIAELADESFIAMRYMEGVGFHAQVEDICRKNQFVPRITQRAQQFTAIASLVGAGLGVAFVPKSLGKLAIPHVAYRPLANIQEMSNLALAFRKLEHAPAVVSLVEQVRRRLRGRQLDSNR
jgi:DNA-binding transcriptional LysR family regulator